MSLSNIDGPNGHAELRAIPLGIVVLGLSSPRETRDHKSIGDWPSSLDRSPPSYEGSTSVTNITNS